MKMAAWNVSAARACVIWVEQSTTMIFSQCCVPTPNNVGYLNLLQKDPTNNYEIVEGGAYGKMKYCL